MDIQQLDDALYNKYIAPTEKERSTSIGIEIEMPVVALSGKAVEEEAVISAADKFRERFGFEITSRDDNGNVNSMTDKVTGDNLSFDCSYSNLELSMGKSDDLNILHERFLVYYDHLQGLFAPLDYTLTGMGIDPHYNINYNRPVPNERYRMLYHYLHSYRRYEGDIGRRFHDRPDFGTFTSASQVQLDVAHKASESLVLPILLKNLKPQEILLGHIRFATVGSIRYENCHPFADRDITGRQWTLIHNGTIYSGSRLIPYLNTQKGDTDSERLFRLLIDTVNSAQQDGELDSTERCEVIEKFIRDIAPRNKLNLMIYDGEQLYIHKNMENTMCYRKLDTGHIFSTTPLDDEEWTDVPTAQLLVYRDGERVCEGKPHDGVFVPTLQYIRAMDAMNI